MITCHVSGGGLAGLSAALAAVDSGARVTVYEAAPQAGGRCRSFDDPTLGRTIDNGNHIVLGANAATRAYLALTGGEAAMFEVAPARFDFVGLASGERWSLLPASCRLPWWVLIPRRRPPYARFADFLGALRLWRANDDATVADCLDMRGPLGVRLWRPLAVAVMNAPPETAAARPFARVLGRSLFAGERACRPMIARDGLSAALAEPAVRHLEARGVEFRFNARLTGLDLDGQAVRGLAFANHDVALTADDVVVLAVPAHVAAELVPELVVPEGASAIVNAHFRLPTPIGPSPRLIALIGGLAEWLIVRGDVASATVSAADRLLDHPANEVLALLWRDVAEALALHNQPTPPARLIKERRATFAQTPANERRRPSHGTRWTNLALAGDWTATGWPATIEGAVVSGKVAAESLLRSVSPHKI